MRMKNANIILLCACLGFCAPAAMMAQNAVPVTISSEVISSNGYTFYAHKVLPKQTLYSISKAYGVSVDQVYSANAGLRESGLKAGSIILIPKSTPSKTLTDAKQKEVILVETEPQTAKPQAVKPQETREIAATKHVVKWYEDLDAISDKYGVPVEVIVRFNGLKDKTVSSRQVLMIPSDKSDFEKILASKAESEAPENAPEAPADNIHEDPVHQEAIEPQVLQAEPQESIHIALALPFCLDKENQIDSTGKKAAKKNEYKDFYSGVLLAIRNNPQVHVTIDVYDTGRPSFHKTYLSRELDAVIGPVSASEVEMVLSMVGPKTVVVSPLDQAASASAASHANFISIPPDKKTSELMIAGYLAEDYAPGDNVVVVSEIGVPLDTANIMRPLWNAKITPMIFTYDILDGLGMNETMEAKAFRKDAVNRVIINSTNDGFISDAIRNVNLLIHTGHQIALYAPNKVRNYPSMEVENFHNTSLQTACPYYIDYENADVRHFVAQYRALYRTEPGSFAFQGYDVASLVIKAISENGADWVKFIEGKPLQMLQSVIDLRKTDGNEGYVNCGLRRLQYLSDYRMELR